MSRRRALRLLARASAVATPVVLSMTVAEQHVRAEARLPDSDAHRHANANRRAPDPDSNGDADAHADSLTRQDPRSVLDV